ncbi:hypothetical protein BJ741DRAFT_599228 [Chytriomyces cf. hyalinus JEL632]|nr:hypothetical protein BJ741DRAFT_599228 [Chytriomyces cf. hyalinus JEL632]
MEKMAKINALSTESRSIQHYVCQWTGIKPALTGMINSSPWTSAPWTSDYIDITGNTEPRPRFRTRTKMLWDDEYFYFAAEMEEPHVWTNITEKNAVVYWQNDWEIFIDPDGDGLNYYEFEVNALNTIWELTLDKPYSRGGQATHPTNIDGLVSAVYVDGTVNDSSDVDRGWSVEVAIPWAGLQKYNINPPSRATPPSVGDSWRVNFSRVEWPFRIDKDGAYVRIPDENRWDIHYEDNWSWSSQGEINMHIPEKWGVVVFAKEAGEGAVRGELVHQSKS